MNARDLVENDYKILLAEVKKKATAVKDVNFNLSIYKNRLLRKRSSSYLQTILIKVSNNSSYSYSKK